MFDTNNYNTMRIEPEFVNLEVKSFVSHCVLPPYSEIFANIPELEVHKEMFERLQMTMMQRIATQTLSEELVEIVKKVVKIDRPTYQYPKNWFQHLKQRFAPKWILNKYPVKYEVIDTSFETTIGFKVSVQNTAEVYYPQIQLPSHQHYVKVMKPVIFDVKGFVDKVADEPVRPMGVKPQANIEILDKR